jgi:phosphoadenosine phosphosulfate reductase
MAFVGVRADESVRRSEYDYISYGTKHKGQFSCNPILSWNSAEVYLYIYANNLHLNKAYKRGNTRAGCLVCPMSTNRNDYLNNYCYNNSTQPLLNIIHDLNASDKGNEERIKSYIENNGWKARKNGRDLTISPKDYSELVVGNELIITFHNNHNEWLQWVKTLGRVLPTTDNSIIKIECFGNEYTIKHKTLEDNYCKISVSNEPSVSNILFLKKIRKVFRKSHYCIGCRVCEANCKYGNLTFDEQNGVKISDKCVKCGQCLDIDTGYMYINHYGYQKG